MEFAQSALTDTAVHLEFGSMADSLAPPTGEAVPQTKAKYFGKTKDVHQMLGGGRAADVLLWRKWQISAGILAVAAVAWILFELSNYTLLTLLGNTALLVVLVVFAWAQVASLLKWPPPPVPELQLTEEHVQWAANTLRNEVNQALAVAHNVAMGKDYKQFFQVVAGLYVLAYVGSWFSTLSLFFFGVLLAFTVPVFYEKYEDQVDAHLKKGLDELHKVYFMVESKVKAVMNKIPHEPKTKKTQ